MIWSPLIFETVFCGSFCHAVAMWSKENRLLFAGRPTSTESKVAAGTVGVPGEGPNPFRLLSWDNRR